MTTNPRQRRFWLLTLVALAMLALAVPISAQADDAPARVRFLHALPGAGAVDVYIDDQLTLSELAFGAPSLYVSMPAGNHTVTVTQSGVTTALWQQTITPTAGVSLTLIVASTSPLEFTVYQDDLNPLPEGKSRVTGIHAIAGGEGIDVLLADGRALVPGLQYGTPYGTLDIPTGVYELAIVSEGDSVDAALVPVTPFSLNSSTSYALVAYGTPSLPNVLALSAQAFPADNAGGLRLVHAVAGADAVDVYLNDLLVAPALSFGSSTVFMPVTEGDYVLTLRPAGEADGDVLATIELSVETGIVTNVLVAASSDGIGLSISPVGSAGIAPEVAAVEVLNVSSSDVDLAAGATNLATVAAGSNVTTLTDATTDDLTVSAGDVNLLTVAGPIYGGAYYTVVIADSADGVVAFALPPVSVATTIGSAPGAVSLAAAPMEATPTPTPAPVIEAEATTVPAETAAPAAATPAPATGLPTARVLTDPGVNVHLRQYPSSAALSLTLLGSGTVVDVLGRPGAPTFPPDATATPEGTPPPTPFVDPATLLASPAEDLDPAQTWLFVRFDAPDGGTITGWINALFLAVTAPNGQPQRLANLPLVAANTAGEVNSSFQPTLLATQPFEDQVVATIDQLNPGSNLHLRRNPTSDSESLGLIPAGTQVVVEGINDTREWYRTTYNGVTGWISATYVSLTYNGRFYSPDSLSVLATPVPTETPLPTPAS